MKIDWQTSNIRWCHLVLLYITNCQHYSCIHLPTYNYTALLPYPPTMALPFPLPPMATCHTHTCMPHLPPPHPAYTLPFPTPFPPSPTAFRLPVPLPPFPLIKKTALRTYPRAAPFALPSCWPCRLCLAVTSTFRIALHTAKLCVAGPYTRAHARVATCAGWGHFTLRARWRACCGMQPHL